MIYLQTENLSIGYQNKIITKSINISLQEGELVSLLGANGVGKSTLLRTLAGVQAPKGGAIFLNGKPLNQLKKRQIAQQISLVLTDRIDNPHLKVRELVCLGRYPHTDWLGELGAVDQMKIEEALTLTKIIELADKRLTEISDGERQKVMIARALAQDTPLLFLDEPTAHLDVPNRFMIFGLLRQLAHNTRKAILLITHDLDLALQLSDKIWLQTKPTSSDKIQAEIITGLPEDLVLQGIFEQTFKQDNFQFSRLTGAYSYQPKLDKKISLTGESTSYHWTARALHRVGYEIIPYEQGIRHIQISTHQEKTTWRVNENIISEDLEGLLKYLGENIT
jgi:iron complex transport system ATP-binding protein